MAKLLDQSLSRRTFVGTATAAGAVAALGAEASARTQLARKAPAVLQNIPEEFIIANELEPSLLLPVGFGNYGSLLVVRQVYQNLMDPRITLDENGKAVIEAVPKLALNYEQVDDLRYRFFLRNDVVFHNGEKLTADAVKATYDAFTDEATLAQLQISSSLKNFVTACEIVDDMTVDFIADHPDGEIPLAQLRGLVIVPPEHLRSNGLASFGENPIGTGAYQFKSWTRGQDIQFTRFADYWETDGPNMPAVRFISRPEASVRAQTISAGEAHLAYNIGIEYAQGLEKYTTGGGFQSSGLRLNNVKDPTTNHDLRLALNLAIDREGIIESIFYGEATPLAFFGFQPVELTPYPYDPDQATKLIGDAGLNGAELDFVYGENRIPEEPQLAEIYQASFEAVGLKINLSRIEVSQYDTISGAEWPEQPHILMETTSSGNNSDIGSGLRDKYGCKGTGTYCNEDFDAEFLELAALSGDEKAAKLQSIAERLHQEVVSRVWTAGVVQVHGLAPNVETDFGLNTFPYLDHVRFT